MALSQKNIEKLRMNGIYRCDPVLEWLPSYKRDTPYWCKNWTFKPKKLSDNYYMYDTYWSTGDSNPIKLTDENFDKFEFLFDLNDIRYVDYYSDWIEYPAEDKWCVPLNSGGIHYPRYIVRLGAKKIKDRVVERIKREIEHLKSELEYQEKTLQEIESGEITDYRWV